ncbi:hypothetical protein ACNKHU_18910 [Shigella flexneri]
MSTRVRHRYYNGATIAYAGMVRFKAGATADLGVSVRPRGRWRSYRLRKTFGCRRAISGTALTKATPRASTEAGNHQQYQEISPRMAPCRQ